MGACLYLFLARKGIKLLFKFLVVDVDYGELLSVVTCGSVGNCLTDEFHLLGRELFALVSAARHAVENCIFY